MPFHAYDSYGKTVWDDIFSLLYYVCLSDSGHFTPKTVIMQFRGHYRYVGEQVLHVMSRHAYGLKLARW